MMIFASIKVRVSIDIISPGIKTAISTGKPIYFLVKYTVPFIINIYRNKTYMFMLLYAMIINSPNSASEEFRARLAPALMSKLQPRDLAGINHVTCRSDPNWLLVLSMARASLNPVPINQLGSGLGLI